MTRHRKPGDIVCEVTICLGLMMLLASAVGVVAYAFSIFKPS